MKQPTTNIQTFAKVAEDAAKTGHGDTWPSYVDDYRCYLMSDLWLNHLPSNFDIGVDGRPKPITRDLVWRLLGLTGRPQAVRDWPEQEPPPWGVLAASREWGYKSTIRILCDRLALLDFHAEQWVQECNARHRPSRGRKPETKSQRQAILNAYDALCVAEKVSYERGGLAQAARDLWPRFTTYKLESIRKIIQGIHNDNMARANPRRSD